MKNFYRPIPYYNEDNLFNSILEDELKKNKWQSTGFKFWNPYHLYKNKTNCQIITMHWPEGFWRSRYKIISLLKAFYFILIFYFSKILNYKWVFYAHNVFPHYDVSFIELEKAMRFFILRTFDLVIGLAYNTKDDLEKKYKSSGRKYKLCIHGVYENIYKVTMSKNNFRKKYGIEKKSKVILIMNNKVKERKNRNSEKVISELLNNKNFDKKIFVFITGEEPINLKKIQSRSNFHFYKGRIKDNDMGNIFNSVDFLFLNYKSITTSGLFFLSLAFDTMIIAPNLSFFFKHTSNKTAILYDKDIELKSQFDNILMRILQGPYDNKKEFAKLRSQFNFKKSARANAKLFNELIQNK
jgi:hypothetical protein